MTQIKNKNGFTLMELLIVVTIVGILASIILPRFLQTSSSNDKYATKAEIQVINAQMELYYYQNNEYPVPDGRNISEWPEISIYDYFPAGVPSADAKGIPYVVKNGRIEATSHNI